MFYLFSWFLTGLSRLQQSPAFTRAICSSSRESIRGAEGSFSVSQSVSVSRFLSCSESQHSASESQPLVVSSSRLLPQESSGSCHGTKSTSRTVENELERIASESLRINGVSALRSLRQLRKPPQHQQHPLAYSTHLPIQSVMKNTSADSDVAQGLISVSSEHPHAAKFVQQRSVASNSFESSDKRKSNCGQSLGTGVKGPAGFYRPNVGMLFPSACKHLHLHPNHAVCLNRLSFRS